MLTGPSLPTPTGAHELTRQGPNPRLPHGQVDPLPLSSQGRPSKDLKTRYFKSPIFQLFFFGLHHAACGISGPRPGTAPRPPAGKALQPFDWTCFPLLSSVPSLSFLCRHGCSVCLPSGGQRPPAHPEARVQALGHPGPSVPVVNGSCVRASSSSSSGVTSQAPGQAGPRSH